MRPSAHLPHRCLVHALWFAIKGRLHSTRTGGVVRAVEVVLCRSIAGGSHPFRRATRKAPVGPKPIRPVVHLGDLLLHFFPLLLGISMQDVVLREDGLERRRPALGLVQHLRLLDAAFNDLQQRARNPELDVDPLFQVQIRDRCLGRLPKLPLTLGLAACTRLACFDFGTRLSRSAFCTVIRARSASRIGTRSLAARMAT